VAKNPTALPSTAMNVTDWPCWASEYFTGESVYKVSTPTFRKEIPMSNSIQGPQRDPAQTAYEDGRRFGLATAALALGVVSFVNMLGIEKSILAIVLAILAMQGAGFRTAVLRRGRTALILASVHVITSVVVLVIFRARLMELVQLLHKLS